MKELTAYDRFLERQRIAEERMNQKTTGIHEQRLMPILNRAESNASGNPEWEDVSGRVNKARAAIAKANV
jgi:hypothetical protein